MAEDLIITISPNGTLSPEPADVEKGQGVSFKNEADCTVTIKIHNTLFGTSVTEILGKGRTSDPFYVSNNIEAGIFEFTVSGSCFPSLTEGNVGDGPKTGHIRVKD